MIANNNLYNVLLKNNYIKLGELIRKEQKKGSKRNKIRINKLIRKRKIIKDFINGGINRDE
ncbi:hypothetical protein [Clostridium cochlearium]|uniref:hypothetical protein n=1 Tax=Clostridium cochlearium TaxID=1494 RepID=UPI0017BD08DE|nr:hypothetical protein [Clostridium cochlearium]NMA58161.1 hypothetical protein [Clostridium cochlearium]